MVMVLERGLELVASRLSRLDTTGYQQGTADAKGRFRASTFEPDSASDGSAWCVLHGVEPTSKLGNSKLYVAAVLLLKRDPLAPSLRAIHRLMSPDNPFGLLQILKSKNLNEKAYAGVTWRGDDWTADAYSPPTGADQAVIDQINTANGDYCFTVDVQAMESVEPEDKDYAKFLAMRAMLEITPIYLGRR